MIHAARQCTPAVAISRHDSAARLRGRLSGHGWCRPRPALRSPYAHSPRLRHPLRDRRAGADRRAADRSPVAPPRPAEPDRRARRAGRADARSTATSVRQHLHPVRGAAGHASALRTPRSSRIRGCPIRSTSSAREVPVARAAARDAALPDGQPLLRGRSAVADRGRAVRRRAARLGAGEGDLRLGPLEGDLQLSARAARRARRSTSSPSGSASAATSSTWRSPSAAA